MSFAPPPSNSDYPEVHTGPLTALIITSLSALAYAVIFGVWGGDLRSDIGMLWASFGLATALLVLAFVDLRTGLLLDLLTLPLIAAGIGVSFMSGLGWGLSVLGAIIGYGVIAALALYWRRIREYEGIGLGDAKLLAAGGAWVGPFGLPIILLIASGLGIISALTVSQKTRKGDVSTAIAFGPCLCFAIWVVWCVGETIVR